MVWSESEKIVLPIMLVCIIAIAVVVGIILKNKSKKIKSLPLQIVAGIVVILELIKQIRNIVTGFSPWALPLHFCSLFLFFFPFAQFGTEKSKTYGKPVALICALAMFLLFYINPGSVIGDSSANVFANFGSFHTFTFHHLVILYVALSFALGDYTPKKKDFLSVLIIMGAYYIIGMSASHIFDVNYCNFLTSNIGFMESLRLSAGKLVYSIAMFFAITGGTTFLCYLYYLVDSFIRKKSAQKMEKGDK